MFIYSRRFIVITLLHGFHHWVEWLGHDFWHTSVLLSAICCFELIYMLSHVVWVSCLSQLQVMLGCGSSNPSHQHIPLCLERYAPCSWFCLHYIAAWTDVTKCSLYSLECCSRSLSGFWKGANASCSTAWSPWLKRVQTWSLIQLSRMLSQYVGEWWRASLHWPINPTIH